MATLLLGGASGLQSALAQQPWDACQLLRQADVESAFAPRKFDAGTLAKSIVKKKHNISEVSICTYVSSGATPRDVFTVTFSARRVSTDASGVTPEVARAGAVKLNGKPVDVAGLGAGAFTVDLGSTMFPAVELNVFKGRRIFLTFGGGGMPVSAEATLQGLRKFAAATNSRLE